MAESVWDKHIRAIIHENFLALQETTSPDRDRRTFSVSSRTPAAGSASLDVLDKQQARHTRPKGTFQERVKAKEDKAKENEADRIRALEHANSALLQELAEARLRAPIKKDTGSSRKRARADDGDEDEERRPRKVKKVQDEDFVPDSDDEDEDDKENTLPAAQDVISIVSSQEEETPKPRKTSTRKSAAAASDENAGGKATKAKVTRKTAGKEKAAGLVVAAAAVPDKPKAHVAEERRIGDPPCCTPLNWIQCFVLCVDKSFPRM